MRLLRFRRLISGYVVGWCVAAMLLVALQPFLATHFRSDGWEDEPALRVRNVEATALFYQDGRAGHGHDLETTLYVAASLADGVADTLAQGLGLLLALVLLLAPLTVALFQHTRRQARHIQRPLVRGGAPPPARPWHCQPPVLAPPVSN